MAEIIDLTVSPQAEIIEISSEYSELNESALHQRSASFPLGVSSLSTVGEPGLFFFDGATTPVIVEDGSPVPELAGSERDGNNLLLPSHVAIFRDDGASPIEVLPPPRPDPDDEEYIEYLDYEDRKAPGLVRYFDAEGEESSQSKPSIYKCKNCGAESDHKTYECPIQICLTCGARDEHSTRSCPNSKTCYTCGMKGHINKMCPNRFSAYMASSDFYGDCNRCGSTGHKTNECPTLWRMYQYVNDGERATILQDRGEKKQLVIGEGGEGYVGEELWCYYCASTGHLGDNCDELPHPGIFPTEPSAFSFHNVMSGPFYDPAAEPVFVKRGLGERDNESDRSRLPDNWDTGAPVNVGKRGRTKNKEKLEKRFKEQEDEGEDWFDDVRNAKRKGTYQAPPPRPREKTLKFGLLNVGACKPASPPHPLSSNGGGPSLLARLSGSRGERDRGKGNRSHESSRQFENSIRIRGAATNQRNHDGNHLDPHKTVRERGRIRWDRDKSGYGGSKRDHGPQYRGGYDR